MEVWRLPTGVIVVPTLLTPNVPIPTYKLVATNDQETFSKEGKVRGPRDKPLAEAPAAEANAEETVAEPSAEPPPGDAPDDATPPFVPPVEAKRAARRLRAAFNVTTDAELIESCATKAMLDLSSGVLDANVRSPSPLLRPLSAQVRR